MKLCFFTMANYDPRPLSKCSLARNLVFSGVKFNRPVWFFRIPKNEDNKRYKISILKSDMLPEAEKHIYMDADCLMLTRGNWEGHKVIGARLEKPRTHRLFFKTRDLKHQYDLMVREKAWPEVNTGCVVFPSDKRVEIAKRWEFWCQFVDNMLEFPSGTRDQLHFRFVRKEFELPVLPEEYCSLATVEEIGHNTVLAHFSAFPRSYAKYKVKYKSILGKEFHDLTPTENMKHRWMSIVDLVLKYAPNPTNPVGAEIGVHKGETTNMLMKAFPGLKLYCIDPWEDMPRQRKPWHKYYESWEGVKSQYPDRIIEQRTYSLQAKVDDFLDFVFIDGDHTSEAVEKDIIYWQQKVKPGGLIIGHDIGFKGTYYDRDSVKRGVEAVFKKDYQLAPGFVWWKQKK